MMKPLVGEIVDDTDISRPARRSQGIPFPSEVKQDSTDLLTASFASRPVADKVPGRLEKAHKGIPVTAPYEKKKLRSPPTPSASLTRDWKSQCVEPTSTDEVAIYPETAPASIPTPSVKQDCTKQHWLSQQDSAVGPGKTPAPSCVPPVQQDFSEARKLSQPDPAMGTWNTQRRAI